MRATATTFSFCLDACVRRLCKTSKLCVPVKCHPLPWSTKRARVCGTTDTHVPRFSMATVRGQGEALAHLQEEGYVVIKDVLNSNECGDALEMLWQELEMAPGVSRHDPSTWADDSTFGNNWGHSDFLWYVRGLPNVRRVWEMIHKTEDLLVSFDGASLYRPWGINPEWCVFYSCPVLEHWCAWHAHCVSGLRTQECPRDGSSYGSSQPRRHS